MSKTDKLTTGPLGFKMPDKLAQAADAALKKVPKSIKDHFKTTVHDDAGKPIAVDGYCRRAMEVKAMDFNDGERAEVSTITSSVVDHDREVVIPRGLDFEPIQKSPGRVALAHNYKIPCVGHCMWIKLDSGSDGEVWKAKTRYAPRPDGFPADQEWLPETAWFYVKEGLLGSKSIGFIPMACHNPTPDDLRANPDWADAYYIIDEAIVLEYSVCAIGANPDSLVEGTSKIQKRGIKTKSLTDALGLVIPDAEGAVEDEKKTLPPIVKSFIHPDTIRQAAERKAMAGMCNVAKNITDGLADRLAKEMGRV